MIGDVSDEKTMYADRLRESLEVSGVNQVETQRCKVARLSKRIGLHLIVTASDYINIVTDIEYGEGNGNSSIASLRMNRRIMTAPIGILSNKASMTSL